MYQFSNTPIPYSSHIDLIRARESMDSSSYRSERDVISLVKLSVHHSIGQLETIKSAEKKKQTSFLQKRLHNLLEPLKTNVQRGTLGTRIPPTVTELTPIN